MSDSNVLITATDQMDKIHVTNLLVNQGETHVSISRPNFAAVLLARMKVSMRDQACC